MYLKLESLVKQYSIRWECCSCWVWQQFWKNSKSNQYFLWNV